MAEDNQWKQWRDIGELLGRVQQGLGFGDVDVRWSNEMRGCIFRWLFRADRGLHLVTWTVGESAFFDFDSMEDLASDVVEHMKHEARDQIEQRRA